MDGAVAGEVAAADPHRRHELRHRDQHSPPRAGCDLANVSGEVDFGQFQTSWQEERKKDKNNPAYTEMFAIQSPSPMPQSARPTKKVGSCEEALWSMAPSMKTKAPAMTTRRWPKRSASWPENKPGRAPMSMSKETVNPLSPGDSTPKVLSK